MAVTSIWRVKGWLGKVMIYVENPEKTENPAFYKTKQPSEQVSQSLADVMEYAVDRRKTKAAEAGIMQQFVSGVNCYPGTAREEMLAVKRRFGKEDGTVAYHGYQSFAPGEATPELAHEIGVRLAQRLWGEKYQVIVATHLDKENHLHNHFVVNTVSFIDGSKYHRTEKDYYEMQKASDALCREYQLSVIEQPRRGKSRHYGEWKAEQEQRPTWRGIVRADVDEAIRQSMTQRQFFDALRKKGYEIKVGKDISVRPPGKERFVRLVRNFGEDYSLEGIQKRLLSQQEREKPTVEQMPSAYRATVRGSLKSARKIGGFRGLYLHYCYLLGILPKSRKLEPSHFLLKQDLIQAKSISEEAKLLVRNHIDTAQQLFCYQDKLKDRISFLTAQRKELYRQQRKLEVKSDAGRLAAAKAETAALSKELSVLRKEVVLCDSIARRSEVMRQEIQTVREDEKSRRKETIHHEHIR